MKRILFFVSIVLLSCTTLSAQMRAPKMTNPVINEDNSVTFKYVDTKAVKVQVTGDFFPEILGTADMVEKDGVWEYTTQPLPSEMYRYNFIVDGKKIMDQSCAYVIRDVADMVNFFLVPGEQADLYRTNDVPHGNVSKVWYDSPTLGYARRMTVYTPAGYESSKAKYPTLYICHGGGGDEEAWVILGKTIEILDNLIAAGKMKPVVAVMTNGNANQQCAVDILPSYTPQAAQGVTFEQSFKDVVKYVESHYRVIKNKDNRALCGLSMGGGHTFTIGLQLMDQTFGYIGIFSTGMFGSAANLNANGGYGVFVLQEKLPQILANPQKYNNVYKKLIVTCGEQDPRLEYNKKFVNDMRAAGVNIDFKSYPGNHQWKVWRQSLADFAQMLFK